MSSIKKSILSLCVTALATAFSIPAEGSSVYSIVDNTGATNTVRRFYHFYQHPTYISDGSAEEQTFPYVFQDSAGTNVNVQIVKAGDILVEPPAPPDDVNGEGNLVRQFVGWYWVKRERRAAGFLIFFIPANINFTEATFANRFNYLKIIYTYFSTK